jgi:hypothetical protein
MQKRTQHKSHTFITIASGVGKSTTHESLFYHAGVTWRLAQAGARRRSHCFITMASGAEKSVTHKSLFYHSGVTLASSGGGSTTLESLFYHDGVTLASSAGGGTIPQYINHDIIQVRRPTPLTLNLQVHLQNRRPKMVTGNLSAKLAESVVGHDDQDRATQPDISNPDRDGGKYADKSGKKMKALVWMGKNDVRVRMCTHSFLLSSHS